MNEIESGKVEEVAVDNEVKKGTDSNSEIVTNQFTLSINSSKKSVDISSMMFG